MALIGLSSCTDSNDPAPPNLLLGKWQGVSTRYVDTSPTGAVVHDSTITYAPRSYVLEYTTTEVLSYSGPNTVFNRFDYTRVGDNITIIRSGVGDTPEKITELTTTKLVLVSTRPRRANSQVRTQTFIRY